MNNCTPSFRRFCPGIIFILLSCMLNAQNSNMLYAAPIKMNLLYVGVDNPVEIRVAGVDDRDVQVSIKAPATITKDTNAPGIYYVFVPKAGKYEVSVRAKINGTLKDVGMKEFRAKYLPDPVPLLDGKIKGGDIQASTLAKQHGLTASLPDFDFNVSFKVVAFEMIYLTKGDLFRYAMPGSEFDEKIKSILGNLKPNDVVIFDGIMAVGPKKERKMLSPMVFIIF